MSRLTLLAALLVGCTSIGAGGEPHDTHDHGGMSEVDCSESGADQYVAGISRDTASGLYTVTIESATPAPPDVGVNEWLVRITDASGAPVTDGTAVVVPWMPAHNHGTSPPEFDLVSNGDGTWQLLQMDLFMPGLWELTVMVDQADGATFRFCLEG